MKLHLQRNPLLFIRLKKKIGKQPVNEIAEERDELLANVKSMEQFKRNSFIVFSGSGAGPSSGDILGMFFDYVRMIFYLDLIKFNQMLRVVRSHPAEIAVHLFLRQFHSRAVSRSFPPIRSVWQCNGSW